MVVGVQAGSRDKAEQLEIVEVRKMQEGVHVKFRFLGRMRGRIEGDEKVRAMTPYHLRLIPKTGLEIIFERVEDADLPTAAPAAQAADTSPLMTKPQSEAKRTAREADRPGRTAPRPGPR